jgi:hypothetical protein
MALHGKEERTIKIIKAVCNSSILKNRSDVLRLFGQNPEPLPTSHFIEKLPIDQTIVRRVLEDMHHQKMVVQHPPKGKNQLNYSLATDFGKIYSEISR